MLPLHRLGCHPGSSCGTVVSDSPPSPLNEPVVEPLSEAAAKPMSQSSGVQLPGDTSDEPTARGATVPMPMTKPGSQLSASLDANQPDATSSEPTGPSPKHPVSYLTGSVTSALMAWLCLLFSQRVVIHFSLHPPHYSARFAQSIATALKTLIIGMGFLSTFSCAFVALGLFLVFIRSLSRAEAPGAS